MAPCSSKMASIYTSTERQEVGFQDAGNENQLIDAGTKNILHVSWAKQKNDPPTPGQFRLKCLEQCAFKGGKLQLENLFKSS